MASVPAGARARDTQVLALSRRMQMARTPLAFMLAFLSVCVSDSVTECVRYLVTVRGPLEVERHRFVCLLKILQSTVCQHLTVRYRIVSNRQLRRVFR